MLCTLVNRMGISFSEEVEHIDARKKVVRAYCTCPAPERATWTTPLNSCRIDLQPPGGEAPSRGVGDSEAESLEHNETYIEYSKQREE